MNTKKYTVIVLPKFRNEFEIICKKKFTYSDKNEVNNKLIRQIIPKLQLLEYMPKIYSKIEKSDELKRTYRKMIFKQYIIFYTIDESKKEVYISHIFYKKSNYFNKL